MRRSTLITVVLVVTLVAAVYAFRGQLLRLIFRGAPPPPEQQGLTLDDLGQDDFSVVARNLEIIWEIRFLPDGSMLVTERPGRLVRIDGTDRGSYDVSGVRHAGEGGLMGLALHPDFAENRWIYLCYTTERDDGVQNRVERYRFDDGLTDRQLILGEIPGAFFHDGCRLEFGPDGYLYITTGDAGRSADAQDPEALNGKILRLTDEGDVPADNPFENPVYSYGHWNSQGLAWDDRGRLWSTEHGRSGMSAGFDELNRIERAGNYGWPEIQGDGRRSGMITPVLHSGPTYTWAPAGAAYWAGRILFGGLRGEALYEARLDGEPELRVHFHGELGRIRAVRIGPDGMLYLGTSNRDGRGRARRGDDRIVRLDPEALR